jgi:hypothetical protein
MHLGFRGAMLAFAATLTFLGTTAARAGDDGAAPLWVGIGSIFGPLVGLNKDEKEPIDYREHGKIVLPPKMDLPPPGPGPTAAGGAWPVNQETQRKKAESEEAKKPIAGVGDARLRYTHPFPNAPVTIRAADQQNPEATAVGGTASTSSAILGNLNPMSWVGMGKSAPLGPEPDREWLTDPPAGYRAPIGPTGQAAN